MTVPLPSFEVWVESLFQHPVGEPAWWRAEDAVLALDPEVAPAQALEFLTRLFQNPSALASYSDDQAGQGLWFLLDSACSQYMALLRNARLPLVNRICAIESLVPLERELFSLRCPPEPDDDGELSGTCYMLWDLSEALGPHVGDEEIDEACLRTLAKVLCIPHPLCQQSALHGLGHWAEAYPERVAELVDAFLEIDSLHPEVRAYAARARSGEVK